MELMLLSGSFHARSHSQAILRFIADALERSSQARVVSPAIDALPFYTEYAPGERPAVIDHFIAQVARVDGIIICTPEYNHSVPAVLKNAIDWASRPAFHSGLRDKPVSLITQAGSPVGGARAQAHLKLILDSTLSRIHPCHEMMIADVGAKFDHDMMLTDERTRHRLVRHVEDFLGFVQTAQRLALAS